MRLGYVPLNLLDALRPDEVPKMFIGHIAEEACGAVVQRGESGPRTATLTVHDHAPILVMSIRHANDSVMRQHRHKPAEEFVFNVSAVVDVMRTERIFHF